VQIVDSGIILDKKELGENALLITIFSENHGLIKGAVNNKKSKRLAQTIAHGNKVAFNWKARLIDHLGTFTLELVKPLSFKIFSDQLKMLMLQSIFSTLSIALPEGLNENSLYHETEEFINNLASKAEAMTKYIHLELSILSHLGFEIDLQTCALTNATCQLHYLSPKTGRGATKEAGRSHHDKLFIIPDYFYHPKAISLEEFLSGIKITSHFLSQNIFREKNISYPHGRANLMNFLMQQIIISPAY
jgi:DNA repair protein RecO (recombination protein O)